MHRAALAPLVVLCASAAASCRVERAASGRPGAGATAPDSVASAEVYAALHTYYSRLTSRDWPVLAESFWPRATITTIMRPAGAPDDSVAVYPIEAFVAKAARRRKPDCPASFSDEIARANVVTYGPLADAWVTYRAHCGVTRDSVAVYYGMDAFHLMKLRGQWRVAGLTFTMEVPGEPLGHVP